MKRLFPLLFCLSLVPLRVEAAPAKNVLFIAVDDLKPILGCYGDPLIKTPNIDKLARSGTVFLNNQCQQAVCGPTRASLMTGLRPDKTQVWDLKTQMRDRNPDILTLPQYLRTKGYTTAGVGKIFDPRCVDKKLDEPSWSIPFIQSPKVVATASYMPPALGSYQSPRAHELLKEVVKNGIKNYSEQRSYFFEHGGWPAVESADVPDEAYTDGAIAGQGIRYLNELKRAGQPFFLAVGFAKPHLPFVAPKKYWDLYQRDDFKIHPFQKKSANFVEIGYHKSSELRSYSGIPDFDSFSDDPSEFMPEAQQKELIHGYHACVSYLDSQIGRVLDELDRLGLSESTAIVLWGDHGWHLGDHGLWCKHSNFEQATRAPLIFSAPGMKGGQKAGAPVEFLDIFPTLCDLTGVAIPSGLDGVSLVPLMKNPKGSVKEVAISQWPVGKTMGYALRDERYRYIEWITQGDSTKAYDPAMVIGRELYDYQKDSMETVNAVNLPESREVVELMNRRLRDYFTQKHPIKQD